MINALTWKLGNRAKTITADLDLLSDMSELAGCFAQFAVTKSDLHTLTIKTCLTYPVARTLLGRVMFKQFDCTYKVFCEAWVRNMVLRDEDIPLFATEGNVIDAPQLACRL